jgi:endoglucanase
MTADIDLLRTFCETPGPTGFEGPVQRLVAERLGALGEVGRDPLGNVWATWGAPRGPPRARGGPPRHVAVVAHADQIGLIVTFVDEQGYVFVERIGGLAPVLVPGAHFLIHGPAGDVHAVGGRKPTHLVPEDQRDRVPPLHEQFLDIGARSRDEALRRVAVGDAVTFAPRFLELAPGVVAAQALDDRAGVYAAVRALQLYGGEGPARLTAVATVHEETTCMGAKALTSRIDADVIVVVDGDFCSDTPAADAKQLAGEVKLGAGPVLGRGAGSNQRLLALALDTAAAESIPVQVKAYPAACSTDADELMAAGTAATLSLSPPMRYMHSPLEVAHLDDLEATARLVSALARRIDDAWVAAGHERGGAA